MKSMTGFGKEEDQIEQGRLAVELKSVNHRFLDVQCRLPGELSSYEMIFRAKIKEKISRGRIECFVEFNKEAVQDKELLIHWKLVEKIISELDKKNFAGKLDVNTVFLGIMDRPELLEFTEPQLSLSIIEKELEVIFEKALDKLIDTRETEGNKIRDILSEQLQNAENVLTGLRTKQQIFEKDHMERLTKKLQDLTGSSLDEERILTEVAILIDKGDICEEIDRLEIHFTQGEQLLQADRPTGRELDFLLQEMNREVNTIGSKTGSIEIKNDVVQLKTILEKIREQIQNVE